MKAQQESPPRPNRLSRDFISKLNTTIDEAIGYFQIVEMHRKKQRLYSTHISDGFFKNKVFFRQDASKQIECGQIKLFSIVYGRVMRHDQRMFLARWKCSCWDYHKVIGLVKPWKFQKPNINLEGSNIIRWEDTLDQPEPQQSQNDSFDFLNAREKYQKQSKNQTNEENKCQKILQIQSKTISISNDQSNSFSKLVNYDQTQSVDLQALKATHQKLLSPKEIQELSKPHSLQNDHHKHPQIEIVQQNDDFFSSLLNLDTKNSSNKKQRNSNERIAVQQIEQKYSKQEQECRSSLKKLMIKDDQSDEQENKEQESDEDQLDWDNLSKILQAKDTNQRGVVVKQIIDKVQESSSEDEFSAIKSLVQEMKQKAQNNKIENLQNNLVELVEDTKAKNQEDENQQDQEDDEQGIFAVLKKIDNENKTKSKNTEQMTNKPIEVCIDAVEDDQSGSESSQDLKCILSEIYEHSKIDKLSKNKFQEECSQKINQFQNYEIDVSDLVPGISYQNSWLYVKPIYSKIYPEKKKFVLLLILRIKSGSIINFYQQSQTSCPLSAFLDSFLQGLWYKLSLRNINIHQPHQPEFHNHINFHTSSSQITFFPSRDISLKISISDYPYLPLQKIDQIQVGNLVNVLGIVKSTFDRPLKNKRLIKIVILDIKSQASVQLVIFSENNDDIFGDRSGFSVENINQIVNQPILVYNAKVSAYQNLKSLQNRVNTCVIIGQKSILSTNQTTPKIKQLLKWIKQQNHVDEILNDEHKYQPIRHLGDLTNILPNFTLFHILKCKFISVSPFYSYEGCSKCCKKIFLTKNLQSMVKACYNCGPLSQDDIAMRYYISGVIGDVSGTLKIVWGHTECRNVFNGESAQENDRNFQKFKEKYFLNFVQVWVKLNNPDEKMKRGSGTYAVMKIKLIENKAAIQDNLSFLRKYLEYNK